MWNVYRLQCAVKEYTSHSCVISLMRKKVYAYWSHPHFHAGTFERNAHTNTSTVVAIFEFIHSFSILSDDRLKASSKTIPPHSAD
jgi:hypothetical protein